MKKILSLGACLALTFAASSTAPSAVANTCTFTTVGSTMTLDADCTTDVTITVPDGMTLDGAGHVITVVDPAQGGFIGAVIRNGGAVAHVTNVEIQAGNLQNGCKGGDDRLRGIMLEGASGSITFCTVMGLNKGASGCQEGNAVEVRHAPFDGMGTDRQAVTITHNNLFEWQKTGIICNGDVDCLIEHNEVGASATQDNLAANSVQLGFGATGRLFANRIDGNEWRGTSNFAATAILVYLTNPGVELVNNHIRGNSDIGIYLLGDSGFVTNNRVFDVGEDHPNSSYDIGIGNWGSDNAVNLNKVRGFDTPYDGEVGDRNIVIPSP